MLRASSSNPTPQNRFWKQIWTLKVPPKLKHFAWRVAHDLLPTKEYLVKMKVLQDPMWSVQKDLWIGGPCSIYMPMCAGCLVCNKLLSAFTEQWYTSSRPFMAPWGKWWSGNSGMHGDLGLGYLDWQEQGARRSNTSGGDRTISTSAELPFRDLTVHIDGEVYFGAGCALGMAKTKSWNL